MSISEDKWDGAAARYTPQQWKRACFIDSGQGDPGDKSRYKLPVRTPSGELSRAGVRAAAGRINQVDASADTKRQAAAALIRCYREIGETPPDSLRELAGTDGSTGSLERSYADCAVETRSSSDSGQLRIGGIGAPFHRRSQLLAGGAVGHFYEVLDPNTFEESRSQGWPSVVCRAEHDQRMLLGAIHSRTLALTVTPNGLDYECLLPPSPLGQNTYASVERSDYPGSSFTFSCLADSFTFENGAALRTIHSARIAEIGPVSNPAYKDSSVALRSLARSMDADPAEVETYARSGELRRLFTRSDRPTLTAAQAMALVEARRRPQPQRSRAATKTGTWGYEEAHRASQRKLQLHLQRIGGGW